jgi:energy-coupling factor transporter transmembrane protein EcfT
MATTQHNHPVPGYLFAVLVITLGILNLVLVHPVPGLVYILLALFFIPGTNKKLQQKFGFALPAWIKIVLGIFILWFTLGVSDLGDMIDKVSIPLLDS